MSKFINLDNVGIIWNNIDDKFIRNTDIIGVDAVIYPVLYDMDFNGLWGDTAPPYSTYEIFLNFIVNLESLTNLETGDIKHITGKILTSDTNKLYNVLSTIHTDEYDGVVVVGTERFMSLVAYRTSKRLQWIEYSHSSIPKEYIESLPEKLS